ncbi:hypothetical protein B0T19DRAFT_472454 [Cercophora scortea]|uniref:Uncharacterized protein n=1 Tax=Cercophora scortea TaxID=314031 RepID=A0AAE0J5Z8_9PEZI|nr:hypothetical protein B0T19DRAFT_472454 [Cercophora scortea]
MARLGVLLISLLSASVNALPRVVALSNTCNQVAGPSAILSISKENITDPAKCSRPFVSINQLTAASGTVPPSSPLFHKVTKRTRRSPCVSKIPNGTLLPDSMPSYNDLHIIRGPWGAITVRPGRVLIDFEACDTDPAGGDYLLETPSWIDGMMGVSWENNAPELGDGACAFGAFLRYEGDC